MAAPLDYKALFANSPNLYMVLDRALTFVEANEAYLAATFTRREDLIGRNVFEMFPHDPSDPTNAQAARVRASLERVFATGQAEVLPLVRYRVPGPSGLRERLWSGSHTAIRNADGEVEFVLQHMVDVTALHDGAGDQEVLAPIEAGVLTRAQEMEAQNLALDQQIRRFQDLFEQFPGFMAFLRGPEFVFELANAAQADLVGLGRPLIGRPLLKALPELRGQPFPELLEQVARERKAFVGRDMPVHLARVARAPLQTVYVNFVYQPVIDDLGRLTGVMVLGFDVTQERMSQVEARRSRERLERLIEASGAGIWEMDVKTGEIHLDERAAALLDAKHRVYANRDALFEQVVDPDDVEHVSGAAVRALEGPRAGHYRVEHRLRAKPGGHERWIEARGRASHGTTGQLTRFAGTVIDITERMELLRMERQSRAEAERANRLKDEFLAAVSHELRTPLTAISGWIHLLRTTQLSAEKRARAISVIDGNARLQTHLIEDLLDSSRIISGKLTLDVAPVDLAMVIENAVDSARPHAEARRVQIAVDIDPQLRSTMGDARRLQQVVWNLLSNAVKFSPVAGRVQITVAQRGSRVELRVSDQGVGINADFLPKVFDRFSQDSNTTRHQGLGLGLSIVKHIVEAHGGSVDVESPGLGHGATFIVELPSRRKGDSAHPPRTAAPDASNAHVDLDGMHVLVVEDQTDTRDYLRTLLEQAHAKVSEAKDASEALTLVRRVHPDLLVSDIGLQGRDGYDLIRRLRSLPHEDGGDIPAVALTAYASEADHARALDAGFQRHLPKPIDPEALVEMIRELTAEPPSHRVDTPARRTEAGR
jgi:PAS domain S-box-containing protein